MSPISVLRYFYAVDGPIPGREVNGRKQSYRYYTCGQLLAVLDEQNRPLEEYVYDSAGNILKKTVNGTQTTYVYDDSNQLVSSTDAKGAVTEYEYDAAGRLVKEGDKVYQYGWLDKILAVTVEGKQVARFDYHINGQIASAVYGEREEDFLWDGLALIRRSGTELVNEPYLTGGNPVIAGDKALFNDLLGSTLGVKDGGSFTALNRNAFGEPENRSEFDFFTGKPYIGELGYAFLFRNYRADTGKWQTADPLGYPDGWNNYTYCNNNSIIYLDQLGLCKWVGPDGLYYPVPISETDAESHTPPGYTYVPCRSEIYTSSSRNPNIYYQNTFNVFCGNELHLDIPVWYNDPEGGVFSYVYVYDCGQELDDHPGYIVYEISMTVWLHPIIREFDCMREEIIGWQLPNDQFGLSYSYSETILYDEGKVCE